jgi:apolipoprotein N-acyltransferase
LITGAARIADAASDGTPSGARRVIYHNSIHVIGKGGVILDTYDKVHLVPFGEYLPLASWLERFGLRQFVNIPGGFDPGGVRKTLAAPMSPRFAPLVCYEAVFPGEVTANDGKGERPGFMLNVTNDAWFGRTSGPYQHFAQARLRSIEEGLPLVRAANTGISAFVDAYGRILNVLPLGVEGVLDSLLPSRIDATIFARFPLAGAATLLLLAFAAALVARVRG